MDDIEAHEKIGIILIHRAEDIKKTFSELFDIFADETEGMEEDLRKAMIHHLFLNAFFVEITKHMMAVREKYREEMLDDFVLAIKKTFKEFSSGKVEEYEEFFK